MDLWSLKAKLYKLFRNKFPFGYILQQENKSLLTLLNQVPSNITTILDLGTGDGSVLKIIPMKVKRIGIDFNLQMLFNARKNVDAMYICGNVLDLPVKTQSVDLLLIIGVLEYLSNYEQVFEEMFRILKPEAFVIGSFSPKNLWTFCRRLLGHKIYPVHFEKISLNAKQSKFKIIAHNRLIMQHQILLQK